MVLYSTGVAFSRGEPIARVDEQDITETEYQTVVSWTVSEGKTGMLREVSMATPTAEDYALIEFRLTIAGEKQFENKRTPAPLTLPFPDNDLPSGSVVLLECRLRPEAGAPITVYGSITGKEI